MRKFLILLLCVILTLTLAACKPANSNQPSETPSQTLSPVIDNPVDAPLHTFYAISVPAMTEYLTHNDGTQLFEYSYQHIQMQIADQAVADKITLDFLTRIDSTRANADMVAQQAQANYTAGANWSPYKYHIYYSPTRVDQGIISLFGTRTTYTGGMHSDQGCLSVSYDVATGDYLTLGSILNHVDNKQDLCELVLDKLEALDYQYSLFDGYENVVTERFMADESSDEAFYFTNTGLCFYFAPYELAPYATGIITIEIPYGELPGILNDAYFPDEYQPSSGKLLIEASEDANASSFAQLMEVVIHPEGEQVLLSSEKTVRNLTITKGTWTPDGLYYLPDYVIFNATGVSADQAINIRLSVRETLPDLMISYESNGKTEKFYMHKNTADGTIQLLPVE